MKAIYLWVGLVLLVVGCEPTQGLVASNATEMHDAGTTTVVGTNVRVPAIITGSSSACEDPNQTVGTIDLNGDTLTMQNVIVVPRDLHAFSSYLYAMPYSVEGDEVDSVPLIWGVANKKIGAITSQSDDDYTVEVTSLQDYFDTDGYEPQTVAGVCAIDPCNTKPPLVYPQPGCAGFTIVGLINLEGAWLIQGSMFSESRHITFTQTGREVVVTPLLADQSKAELTHNVLRFSPNHYQYVCTFTSRTHCDGKRIDVQTGISVGWWVADRQ